MRFLRRVGSSIPSMRSISSQMRVRVSFDRSTFSSAFDVFSEYVWSFTVIEWQPDSFNFSMMRSSMNGLVFFSMVSRT